jgi:hypothetical protein
MNAEATTKPQNGKTKAAAPAAPAAEDKFFKVTTNPLQYKPETCKDTPIQGRIVSMEKMPFAQDETTKEWTKAWYVFNIELTAPSVGEDISGKVQNAEIGDIVRVPLNKELESIHPAFMAATRAGKYLEIRLKPIERVKLEGVKTMWRYSLAFDKAEFRADRPKGIPALIDSSNSDFANYFPEPSTVAALPENTSNSGGDGEIPF